MFYTAPLFDRGPPDRLRKETKRFFIMLTRIALAVFSLFILMAPVVVRGDSPAVTNKIAKLTRDLVEIEDRKKAVHVALLEATQALQAQEQQLSYSDPEAARIREEVKALERKMIDLRRQLRDRLRMVEETRKLEDRRKELYRELQKLSELEALTRNEIEAIKN